MRIVRTSPAWHAPAPGGVFAHVVTVATDRFQVVEISGQMAVDRDGAVVAPGDPAAQSRVVFDLVDRLLAGCGASFADVVRVRAHLTSMADAPVYGRELARRVGDHPPASTTVEVAGLFRPGAVVEVDVTAWHVPTEGSPQ